jgi:MFS family permease
MLYPIMPIYLKSIGFSILLIGILEGCAEATAGLSKGYFGKLSDVKNKRLPFVQLGYLFSAVSKPMIALFTNAWWVFSARTLDRLGKGVRTGARDALLSDEATPETKGTVFGFHRAMDTVGAAIGPVIALLFLSFFPGKYRILFFIAFLPGLLGVFTSFLMKEKKVQKSPNKTKNTFFSFIKYIPQSHKEYKILLVGLLAFTLFNSSDVFLLLMLKHQGMSDTGLIGVYIFYNLVYALFSYPL